MKAVMYHYIRQGRGEDTHFRYLPFGRFRRQLDYFEKQFGYISRKDFMGFLAGENKASDLSGVLLTFDDGLLEHATLVMPELLERGLWGCFFISTDSLARDHLLNVHAVHFLLGRYGAEPVREIIYELDAIDVLSKLTAQGYAQQVSGESEKAVKYYFNYVLNAKSARDLLQRIFQHLNLDEKMIAQTWYLDRSQVLNLHQNGMIVGAHSCQHTLFNLLSEEELEREIDQSFSDIRLLTEQGSVPFCYPFGGPLSRPDGVQGILRHHHCQFAFDVKSREIDNDSDPLALPRFDCNEFEFGSSQLGPM